MSLLGFTSPKCILCHADMTLNSSASCRFFIAFRSLVSAGHAQPHRTVRISRTANLHKSTWREFSASRSTLQRESLTPQTHFDLFPKTIPNGPPPTGTFDIDLAQLKKEFLQLQAKAHPDRHAGPDKARAEGASMMKHSRLRIRSC
jgi:molecular chaperone HscB